MPDISPQYRPVFHFSPQRSWMNDPNGLVFADGVYHLFYQYHPDGLTWGPMHWGHATSRDLRHWDEQPIALYPDDLGMIFSGSIVIDHDNTSGLGHNGKTAWVAIFTHHDPLKEKAGGNVHQYQSIAYSLDDGVCWTKYAGNPVLPNPGIKDFRDPKVFWHDDTRRWVMSLAASDRILFYSSADLKNWALESEFDGFDIATGNVVECPDLVALDFEGCKRWVLIVSVVTDAPNGGSGTRYIVGDFDGYRFVAEHDDVRWLDHGPDNYAGVTFHNTGDQVLLIGWMSNWAYAQAVPTAPWRSAMTLPRELRLVMVDGKAVLSQSVPSVFDGQTSLDESWPSDLTAVWRVAGGVLNLCLKAENQLSFELTLGNDIGDRLTIGYDSADQLYYIDRRNAGQSSFSPDFPIRATAPRVGVGNGTDIKLYFDKGSVELFADNGTTTMTCLNFPRADYTSAELRSSFMPVNGRLTLAPLSPKDRSSNSKDVATMKQVLFGAIATLLLSSACIAKDRDRLLELSGDYTIDVTINGQSFKLLVDPDIGGSRVLNAETASKLGLKGSMIGGRHMVGPVKLTANSNVLNYDFGDVKDKQRTFWLAEGAATDRAAGTIAPAALPYPVVRFQLREAVADEKLYTLPLADDGKNATLMVGGNTVAVGFNLLRNETLVTASTGVLIADTYQGAFAGEGVSTMIRYGIQRPTRPLKLGQAIDIGGLSLDQMLVRVSDFGDASQIADSADVDQDEIVVTAASKKKPRYLMTLGRDFLARCSALTFDAKAKQVQMRCAL